MADLSQYEIIRRRPTSGMLEPARSQFNSFAEQLGFATPSEAIRGIANGGKIC